MSMVILWRLFEIKISFSLEILLVEEWLKTKNSYFVLVLTLNYLVVYCNLIKVTVMDNMILNGYFKDMKVFE